MWLVATILDRAVIDYSIPAEISLGHHRSSVIRRSLPSLTLQLRYPFHNEVFPTPTPCLKELLDCPLQYPTIWELPGCLCELPEQPWAQWGRGLIRVLLFSHSVMSEFWYPTDCSTPGFPVLHYLPKFAQTHIHWVSDAIQPSHSLLPSSPALSLSQHQSLFQWIGSSHQVAKGFKLLFQHQSFQWLFKVDFL